MNQKDYYKILGVDSAASADAIKKAYRKLAKDNHPDANAGDKRAEQRFKEVSEAYSILSDAKKRQQYDQFRRFGGNGHASGGGFRPGTASFNLEDLFGGFSRNRHTTGSREAEFDLDDALGFGNLSEMFGNIFEDRNSGRRGNRSNLDIQVSLQIPFKIAVLGGKSSFTVADKENRKFSVNVPPGTYDGKKLRLAGQGKQNGSGQVGDLILHVSVRPHRFFRIQGNDIFCEVPLSAGKAAKGAKIRVKTIHSETVELTVPPNTKDGSRLKLKGMGIKNGKSVGDQYVTIKLM